MVSVFNSNSLGRVGVERVELASNGMSAEIVFYDNTDEDADPEVARLVNYTMRIGALEFEFALPGYADKEDGAYVTEVDATEREITVNNFGTLEIPESMKFDFQQALGQQIRVWWNADDVVINYEIQSEAIHDAIEFDGDEVLTIDEEVSYDLHDDVVMILNNGSDDEKTYDLDAIEDDLDGLEYDYAKVILNGDDEVIRIYAYDFETIPFIVETVNEDYIVDYDGDELDLEDYVIVKDGMQIAIGDIEEGDLVFYNEDANDGDGFAVVYNKTVTGEIDAVFSTSFDLDGENYDYVDGAKYLNEDNDKDDLDADGAEKLQEGGEVTAYFNHKGEVILVKGAEGVVESKYAANYTTDSIIAYEDVRGNERLELTVVDKDGDEEVYDFEIDDLDEIVVQTNGGDVDYEVDEESPVDAGSDVDGFIFTDDSNIALTSGEKEAFRIHASYAGEGVDAFIAEIDADEQRLIGVATDDEGNITGLKFFEDSLLNQDIDYDDTYVGGKRLQDSTVVIGVDTSDAYPDDDEVSFFTWSELKEDKVDLENAEVFYDEDDDVTHIVVKDNLKAGDTREVNVLVTDVYVDSDENEITRLTALINGQKETLTVDNLTDSLDLEGDLEDEYGVTVALEINNTNDEVTGIYAVGDTDLEDLDGYDILSGYVVDFNVSKRTVEVGTSASATTGTEVELESNGYVYDATDSTPSNESLRDLEKGQQVDVVRVSSGSSFADIIVITADKGDVADDDDVVVTDGTVTYIDKTNNKVELEDTNGKVTLYDITGSARELFVAQGTTPETWKFDGAAVGDAVKATFTDGRLVGLEVGLTAAEVSATTKVAALETAAAKNLTVEANIDNAETAHTAANTAVSALASSTTKTALQGRVTTANAKVTAARTAFDAIAAQLIFDINATNGEGGLSVLLTELDNADYNAFDATQKEEIAKIFAIARVAGPTDFDSLVEINAELDGAIVAYENLIADVNAADISDLQAKLQAVADVEVDFQNEVNSVESGGTYSFTVTPGMAQAVLLADNFGNFESFAEIIEVLTEAGL